MKILILFILMFYINIKPSEKIEKTITITIIDSETKEPLVGVYNKNNFNYSDLNGNLLSKNECSLNLNLISYEELNIKKIKNDTIIKMKPL